MANPLLTLAAPVPAMVDFFSLPAILNDEAMLRVGEGAVSITVRDESGTCLVNVEAERGCFTTYISSGTYEFGIPIKKIRDLLKQVKAAKGPVTFIVDDNNRINMSCGKISYTTALLGDVLPCKRPDPTNWELPVGIVVPVDELRHAADSTAALAEGDGLHFSASGGILSVIHKGDVDSAKYEVGQVTGGADADVWFNGTLIKLICDTLPDHLFTLRLGTDKPLYLSSNQNGVKAEAFLAPLIGD